MAMNLYRALRTFNGLSRPEFAAIIDSTDASVMRLERGTLNIPDVIPVIDKKLQAVGLLTSVDIKRRISRLNGRL
jgi:hypothetical protein